MLAASVWLLATGVLLTAAFAIEANAFLYGIAAAVLFFGGWPAFWFASLGLSRILQCPNCGERAQSKGRWVTSKPEALQSCGTCGCLLQKASVA